MCPSTFSAAASSSVGCSQRWGWFLERGVIRESRLFLTLSPEFWGIQGTAKEAQV